MNAIGAPLLRVWLALLVAATAAADETVAVMPVALAGEAAPVVASSLRGAAAGGYAAGRGGTVPLELIDRVLDANPALRGCTTSPCVKRLGEILGAQVVLLTDAEVVGSSFTFRLRLVETATSRVRGSVEKQCDVCTQQEAEESLSAAALTLALPQEGQGPVAARAPAPAAAGAPGSAPPAAPAQTVAERREPVPEGRPPWRRWAPWAAVGTGVAAIAAGAVMVSLDGRGTCDAPGECPREYATGGGGWALVGLGVVAAGAGAYLLIR